MAVPKKGSRTIVIDNVSFRWRIRHKETYNQLISSAESFIVSVEAIADSNTTTLVVDTSIMRSSIWRHTAPEITPAYVERYIRIALSKGWQPYEKGKPFQIVAQQPA